MYNFFFLFSFVMAQVEINHFFIHYLQALYSTNSRLLFLRFLHCLGLDDINMLFSTFQIDFFQTKKIWYFFFIFLKCHFFFFFLYSDELLYVVQSLFCFSRNYLILFGKFICIYINYIYILVQSRLFRCRILLWTMPLRKFIT